MRKVLFFIAAFVAFSLSPVISEAAEKKEDKSGGAEYVKMGPLLLPIIDEDGLQQVVNMVLSIEVDGVSNADKVKAMSPRLKDAYIQNMYGMLHEHAALKSGVIQIKMIKARLNEITATVVGDDIETDVLIQMVQQRPI